MTELVVPAQLGALVLQPGPAIELDSRSAGWCVRVRNLPPALVTPLGEHLEALLRVKVAEAGDTHDDGLPNVAGDYEILGDGVRFTPRFAFDSGVVFRATLDLGALGRPGLVEGQTLEFSFPRETGSADTKVSHVFPSSAVLPENLLRFYIRFSNPMQRGLAANNIEVLGPDGGPTPDVLYRAPVELWDHSMSCLTVLLDPGRLKRGVGPNRVLGPPLKAGQRYTLVIGTGMIDVYGRPLRKAFNRPFTVSEAVRAPITIEEWGISRPAAGSREPLELTCPRPLDWAQLLHGITVVSETGLPISGCVDIGTGETQWRFTPDEPWQAGTYSVCVAPSLEDICGNTPYGPFDGPFRSADEMALETAIRMIPFLLKAA